MTQFRVADVARYLEAAAWQRRGSWRGASIWARDGSEVLVPARDDMGDNALRMRDLLRTLAAVESRSEREIAREIAFPDGDWTIYRLFPEDRPAGFTELTSGVQAVTGLREALRAASRGVLEGAHSRFDGKSPRPVGELIERVRIGSESAGDVSFTLLVPHSRTPSGADRDRPRLDGGEVLAHLSDAVAAVEEAVEVGQITAFDDTVTAGVSAELCAALSGLAGRRRREPFELEFRWSWAGRPALAPRTVAFPPDAGVVLKAAADRLRTLELSGTAAIEGRIESLHDDSQGSDRWRVRVRGALVTAGTGIGRRGAVWVRLPDQDDYDRAIAAHRSGQLVRVDGVIAGRSGRVELLAPAGGLVAVPPSGDV